MAYTANRLRALLKQLMFLDDPADATVERYVSWQDMRDYGSLLISCMFVSGTGVLTFKIFGDSDAAGGGTPTEIIAHATPTTADAAGDTLVLEITAEQLHALGAGYRYVSAKIDNDAAGDINVFTYTFCEPRFAHDALTADVIAP